MQKLIYGGMLFASIALVSCKKNIFQPAKLDQSEQESEKTIYNTKSMSYKSLNEMAQASNISSIQCTSANSFILESYDDSKEYKIIIVEFHLDGLVKFDILIDGVFAHNVKIDFNSQSIILGTIGLFTFNNFYDQFGMTSSSGTIKNITAVFTAYFATLGNTSTSWADNGDEDVYAPSRRFFGYETTTGPCNELLNYRTDYHTFYVFWTPVSSQGYSTVHPC